jgi:hypothetical protein
VSGDAARAVVPVDVVLGAALCGVPGAVLGVVLVDVAPVVPGAVLGVVLVDVSPVVRYTRPCRL